MLRLFFFIFLCVLLSNCSKKENYSIGSYVIADTAAIELYYPTIGGNGTNLSLYGNNFGTNIDSIDVFVNNVQAETVSSTGRVINAVVQKNSGSGPVKLLIHRQGSIQELVYKYDFQYKTQFLVKTYLGQSSSGIADGSFSAATLRRPRFLLWSSNYLYFVEEGENASGNGGIRVAYNDTVKTIVRNTTSNNLLDRIRSIAMNPEQNTLIVSNDIKSYSTLGLGKFSGSGSNFSNLTTLSGNAGMTITQYHPITGELFTNLYSGAKVCRYDNGNIVSLFQLFGPDGVTPMSSANINSIVFDKISGTTAYIVVRDKHAIYRATYDITAHSFSNLVLFAGTIGASGYVDGSLGTKFNNPCQADIDNSGNLYVADRGNHCIRMITPDGVVSTYVGKGGVAGFLDGDGGSALFSSPEGCQFGPDGALYIADYDNNRIRRVSLD